MRFCERSFTQETTGLFWGPLEAAVVKILRFWHNVDRLHLGPIGRRTTS